MDSEVYIKPTNIWVPLQSESDHPPGVHLHWPLAQEFRFRKLFTNKLEEEKAVDNFFAKMKAFNGYIKPAVSEKLQRKFTEPSFSLTTMLRQTWFALPYHRVWASAGIRKHLAPMNGNLSWKLANKPLLLQLRRFAIDPFDSQQEEIISRDLIVRLFT